MLRLAILRGEPESNLAVRCGEGIGFWIAEDIIFC